MNDNKDNGEGMDQEGLCCPHYAALLQSFALTDEQIKELEDILEKSRDRGRESADKEGGRHA